MALYAFRTAEQRGHRPRISSSLCHEFSVFYDLTEPDGAEIPPSRGSGWKVDDKKAIECLPPCVTIANRPKHIKSLRNYGLVVPLDIFMARKQLIQIEVFLGVLNLG